jgi:hypothetical protein
MVVNCNITNLTSNDLIMKIVWSLFIHRFVHFAHILLCIENTFDTWINVLMDELWTHEWIDFTSSYKCVFKIYNMCVQTIWIYEWTNFAQFPLLNRWMLNLSWNFVQVNKNQKFHFWVKVWLGGATRNITFSFY